jgi:hypothetical protein
MLSARPGFSSWRKSSYSVNNDCVELAWRKSSFTDPNDCVELAWPAEGGAVRDSKNASGPVLTVDATGLASLIAATKAGTVSR